MNYLILIIVAVAGIALGACFARSKDSSLIAEQGKKKIENKQKIKAERKKIDKIIQKAID